MNPVSRGERRHPATGAGGERVALALLDRGEPRGLHLLAHRHARPLYRFALALDGRPAEAEALVRDTFVSAWEDRASRRAGSARSWLLGLCVQRALRRPECVMRTPAPNLPPPGTPCWPERLPEDPRLRAQLRRGILALPLTQRAVFLLCDVEGEDRRAAADALARSPAETARLLHEARLAMMGACDAALRSAQRPPG